MNRDRELSKEGRGEALRERVLHQRNRLGAEIGVRITDAFGP
jgi:hypothetical protein